MAESPSAAAQGPIDVSVESGGNKINVELVAVTVTRALNKIPCASIVIEDGDVAEQDFPVSNGEDFEPGTEITIKAGYGGESIDIFTGVVVRHRIRVGGAQDCRLVIDCRDKAYTMTLDRKNAAFVDKLDSDVFTSLIGNYDDLLADVAATTVTYGELIQYYCTDWDYMLSRAEVNGMVVIVDNGEITVAAPKTDGTAVLEVTFGEDIIKFDADIDGRTQLQSVETAAWNLATQKMDSVSEKPTELNEQGNLTGSKLAEAVGTEKYRLQSPAPLGKESLTAWAKARQLKAGLARIQGNVVFPGNAKAIPGAIIDLTGVGDRFNGSVYLSQVEHRIGPGVWLTHAEFGLRPEWFVENHNVIAPPASGWMPGISGLHVGVVKKLDEDPDKQFRVQVSVPVLGDDAEGLWARLSNYYASNKFGAFFVPEIGDEVVLGFINDDPVHPIILGSLYSDSTLPAPYELTAENNIKALVTRSTMKVEFDDDKKIITIWTPAGNQLVLSEEDKTITLEDQNSNKMTMSPGGIDIESPKDINISADGNVSIKAMGKVDVEATQDASIKGLNVNAEADAAFTAKGGATAELSASANTTVKGAMVMIN